jgi:probable addiction module antidote protein
MGNRSSSYHDFEIELMKDPEERAGFINAALEEGDPKVLLAVLQDCAEALGGISWLSRETRLSRPSLYKIMSRQGNPKFDSLAKVLLAFGLRLNVSLAKKKAEHITGAKYAQPALNAAREPRAPYRTKR